MTDLGPIDPSTIDVEALPEGTPLPYAEEADLAELETPAPTIDTARLLEPVLGVPFYLVPLWLGRGLPRKTRRLIRVAWRVNHDELEPIARALAPMVPASVVASRAGRLAPAFAAATMLAGLIQERVEQTNAIRSPEGETPDDRHPAASPTEPAPAARPGPFRPVQVRSLQPAEQQQGPVDGFEGAGMGP